MKDGTLNKAQIEVLNALASLDSEDDVLELKKAIAEFFARRVDAELNRLWENGTLNEEKLKSWETAHYRTEDNRRDFVKHMLEN